MKIYLVSHYCVPDYDVRLVTTDIDKAINMYLHDPEGLSDAIDVWQDEKLIASYGYMSIDRVNYDSEEIKNILFKREVEM